MTVRPWPVRRLGSAFRNRGPVWRTGALCLLAALLLLAAHCIACLMPLEAKAAGTTEEFVARRDFRGLVHRDMAERAARTAAELAAMEQAQRILAKDPDLRFATAADAGGASVPLPLDGLARMLFATPQTASGMRGFPPDVHAVVHVRLVPPENPRKQLHDALPRQDLLELYAQALAVQRSLVARYDAAAEFLLALHPGDGGGKEQAHILRSIVNEMIAMDIFTSTLPLSEQHWNAPQRAQAKLQKAHALAPGNPLILTSLAKAYLQLDRAPAAMEHVGQALRVNPEFAHAHDVKGAVLLRQRLPALAAESFGRAISLSPRNAAYRVHRAAAYLVLENEAGMCADFQSACALGDCEGFQWAKSAGKCR